MSPRAWEVLQIFWDNDTDPVVIPVRLPLKVPTSVHQPFKTYDYVILRSHKDIVYGREHYEYNLQVWQFQERDQLWNR